MAAGDFATRIPPLPRALIFSAAVPLPPEMIAPACPMRRPGGAVWPAINADDRLLHVRLHELGGRLFGIAADLADHDDRFGLGIAVEQIERIDEVSCR